MEKEFENLKEFLENSQIEHVIHSHETIHTAEEASRVRGVPMSHGVKSIVVKSDAGFFVILVPGDRKINFEHLKDKIGKAKLADPKDVFRVTGCEVGSVHPFGNLFGLRVLMDRHVLDNKVVNFSAGTHNESIAMNPKDIEKLTKAEIGDFSELK